MLELELEDVDSMKRQRLLGYSVPTFMLTPKPTPSAGVSHSRASTERRLRSLDSDGKRDDARTLYLSLSDFYTEDDVSHSVRRRRAS
jgi:hypothetical protein